MKIRLAAGALSALTIALLSVAGPTSTSQAAPAAVAAPAAQPSASHPCGTQAKPGT